MPPTVIRRSIAPYPYIPTSSVAWQPVGVMAACTRPVHQSAANRPGVPLRAAALPPLLLRGEVSEGAVEAPSDCLARAGPSGDLLDRAGVAMARFRQVDVPAAHAAEGELQTSGIAGRDRAPIVLRPHRDRRLAHGTHCERCRHSYPSRLAGGMASVSVFDGEGSCAVRPKASASSS